jgi:membrane-associated protein
MGRYPARVHQHLAFLGLDPTHLFSTFGVVGVFFVIFLEMAVLVFFFLPGDSLLFAAGAATVTGNASGVHLPLGWLLVAAPLAAILGGQVGYEVGRRAGPALHQRPDSRFYRRDVLVRAERLVLRFGTGRAVVLSRFLPAIRTFASPLVGVAEMPIPAYTRWNIVGGLVWTIPLILLGHALGHVTFIRHYIEALAIIVILVSIIPVVIHMVRHKPTPAAPPAERPDVPAQGS